MEPTEPGMSLLEIVQGLPKEHRPRPSSGKADQDYVSPTTTEIEREYHALVALHEIVPPPAFVFPAGSTKKVLSKVLDEVDPRGKVAERATLRRWLKTKKVKVPDGISTADLVQLAMVNGCLGRKNKKRSLALAAKDEK